MDNAFYVGAAARMMMPPADILRSSKDFCGHLRLSEQGSPLKAKALALTFGAKTCLHLALDIVFLHQSHCAQIRKAITAATGVRDEDIVIGASHSHSTPYPEPLSARHPFFDFVKERSVEVALEACKQRRKARFGHATTHVVGASFNTNFPLPDDRVKFTRDFREGLASGRPIDPRLSVLRFDDESGRPIAGWVRFAAHPACVITDAPVSAEYPGHFTEQLSQTVAGGAPVLFGYGVSGDVNCIPMFGSENDSRALGLRLAELAAPVFDRIRTQPPRRLFGASRMIDLPLEDVPSLEQLDREIEEVRAFTEALDRDPTLEWVIGVNCKKDWTVETKQSYVAPLAEWAVRVKEVIRSGRRFPSAWPWRIDGWIIDDLGLAFCSGEPYTALGLALASRSPLPETLLLAISNGSDGYVGTDEDRQRGGYQMYTNHRYGGLSSDVRPLPYALGAGECLVKYALALITALLKQSAKIKK